ncbi:Aste57867_524 [Aphanomyces stellatus]|uniref:Aste57867_524 protein n=1 Tax=Aphanomyces stellatus TaxID=120398 RepID=A0A485K415_9STRA|nr:hypothetical protein As57867_000523 [Aphanomyces stellatus]VFT77749.1 Aste57867_524 [Aphanomyces stellatus]
MTMLVSSQAQDFSRYCNECIHAVGNGIFSDIQGRDTLGRGERIYSSTRQSHAEMQWDSNFVLYGVWGSSVWASNTANSGATRVVMQGDGNLVVVKDDGTPVWASHTDGRGKGPYCVRLHEPIIWGNGLKVRDANCDWFWWSGRSISSDGNETTVVQGTAKTEKLVNDIFERIAQDASSIEAIFDEIQSNVHVRDIFERIATSTDGFASKELMGGRVRTANDALSVDDLKRWRSILKATKSAPSAN